MTAIEVLAEAFRSPHGLHVVRLTIMSSDGSMLFRMLTDPQNADAIAKHIQECATVALQAELMDRQLPLIPNN